MSKSIPSNDSNPPLELGFGSRLESDKVRLLNNDGTFNVERRGLPAYLAQNTYQLLTSLNWPLFIILVLTLYIIVNFIFSLGYLWIGVHQLAGRNGNEGLSAFWDAFFFSAQTLTTVGYGRIAPQGFGASLLAAIESLIGLMGFAIGTGLIYSRFSKPRSKIIFSKNVLISPYKDSTGLMFRMANARKNQLIETEVQVSLSLPDLDGKRKFYDLKLEQKMIHFFALSWTIVHPIDSDSPLFGLSKEDFEKREGEIFIQIKSFDDSFSQTVFLRNSYTFSELVYGGKFDFIFGRNDKGVTYIDLDRISDHQVVEIPKLKTE